MAVISLGETGVEASLVKIGNIDRLGRLHEGFRESPHELRGVCVGMGAGEMVRSRKAILRLSMLKVCSAVASHTAPAPHRRADWQGSSLEAQPLSVPRFLSTLVGQARLDAADRVQ